MATLPDLGPLEATFHGSPGERIASYVGAPLFALAGVGGGIWWSDAGAADVPKAALVTLASAFFVVFFVLRLALLRRVSLRLFAGGFAWTGALGSVAAPWSDVVSVRWTKLPVRAGVQNHVSLDLRDGRKVYFNETLERAADAADRVQRAATRAGAKAV